jgi:hypothetical protein
MRHSLRCMVRRRGSHFVAIAAILLASGCSSASPAPEECRSLARELRAHALEIARQPESEGGAVITARERRRINRPIACQ